MSTTQQTGGKVAVSVRFEWDDYALLEQAARDDGRLVAPLARKIILDWLRQRTAAE